MFVNHLLCSYFILWLSWTKTVSHSNIKQIINNSKFQSLLLQHLVWTACWRACKLAKKSNLMIKVYNMHVPAFYWHFTLNCKMQISWRVQSTLNTMFFYMGMRQASIDSIWKHRIRFTPKHAVSGSTSRRYCSYRYQYVYTNKIRIFARNNSSKG